MAKRSTLLQLYVAVITVTFGVFSPATIVTKFVWDFVGVQRQPQLIGIGVVVGFGRAVNKNTLHVANILNCMKHVLRNTYTASIAFSQIKFIDHLKCRRFGPRIIKHYFE